MDRDAQWEYSHIVAVDAQVKISSFVFPSLINDKMLNLFLNEPYDLLQVVNMSGVIVFKQHLNGKAGKISIPVSLIGTGTYIAVVSNNKTTLRQKIIIKY